MRRVLYFLAIGKKKVLSKSDYVLGGISHIQMLVV